MLEPTHAPAPLAADNGVDFQIELLRYRPALRLRSWVSDGGERAVILDGRALPPVVGAAIAADPRVLCIGPADWLLVSGEDSAASLRQRVESHLRDQCVVAVDQTHGLAPIEVRGHFAREVLSKGCGLDLHPRAFPVGRCARTRLAQIPVVIDCIDEAPRFTLYVARSYVTYLRSWLLDAAAEFAGQLS